MTSPLDPLLAELQSGQRLLGLDVGSKTVGLAISDRALAVASPLETLRRGKFKADADAIKRVCAERNVGALVVGLPVNMDGSEGPRCQSTRAFARNLREIGGIALPVVFWDERLSSSAVERFLVGQADMSRQRRGEVVDKMAAAYILQGALDALHHAKTRGG
ncbi:MAG: Holliday junction resolvase RuvX [Rhodovibrionaceae bacterium]|nr:Holliday junction resolvase RuvX [Rhodovibrionaceae bacterium]